MTTESELRPCSIRDCPRDAVFTEMGDLRNWAVLVHYCDEHARELEKGVPMGGLGIDGSRVEFRPHDGSIADSRTTATGGPH